MSNIKNIIINSLDRWGINALLNQNDLINRTDLPIKNIPKFKRLIIQPDNRNDISSLLVYAPRLEELVIVIPDEIESYLYINELHTASEYLTTVRIIGYEPIDTDVFDAFEGMEIDEMNDILKRLNRVNVNKPVKKRSTSLLDGLRFVKNLTTLSLDLKYVYNGLKELIYCVHLKHLIINNIKDVYSVKNILLIPNISSLFIKSGCIDIYYDDVMVQNVNYAELDEEPDIRVEITRAPPEKHVLFIDIESASTLSYLFIEDVSRVHCWENIRNIEMLTYNSAVCRLSTSIKTILKRNDIPITASDI